MTFRKRLTFFSAAAIALVLVAGSSATYLVVRHQLRNQVDESLRAQSRGVFLFRSSGSGEVTRETFDTAIPPARDAAGIRLALPPVDFGTLPVYVGLIDRTGKPVLPAAGDVALPVSKRAAEVARSGTGAYFTDVRIRGTRMRMYVTPAEAGGALLVGRSLAEVDLALNRLAWSLGVTCLVGILLAAAVGAVVARGALRPVRKLSATAARITATHDLGERIEPQTDDELGRLSATFNEMLDSLEGAVRSQRQLVADASHELRTPLTSLRTNVDLLRQGAALSDYDRERLLTDLTSEIEELTALVANLVDLARGSQRDLHLQPVRLDEIAAAVASRARIRFPQLEIELDTEEATALGDREELQRAIWNLIENAAKWSSEGGRIELTIAGSEIIVRDHGPGVPASDRPFVFDRFYRSDAARSRPGSGLGLAIVRQIAERHGGRIEVDDAPGGGARFTLFLVAA